MAKVAVIIHRLGPYHVARINAAARCMDIAVIELCSKSETYDWDPVQCSSCIPIQTLFRGTDSRLCSRVSVRARVLAALDRENAQTVVIPGWADTASLAAMEWCISRKQVAVVMSETSAFDDRRRLLREHIKKHLISCFSGALVGGTPHADYVVQLGLARNQVFLGYDAVDNEYFKLGAASARSNRNDIRTKYSLPEKFFLASARFIEKKNLLGLVSAFGQYRQSCKSRVGLQGSGSTDPWDLVILGDGPLRNQLNKVIVEQSLNKNVHLPGFKQYRDLPSFYGLASAFVHASTTEQWGLVVNEAMAVGLPVLVSNRCGCAADLVHNGVNGFCFDPFKQIELAELMYQLAGWDPEERKQMGNASERIIASWGPERFAHGLRSAVTKALEVGPKRSRLFEWLVLKALLGLRR